MAATRIARRSPFAGIVPQTADEKEIAVVSPLTP